MRAMHADDVDVDAWHAYDVDVSAEVERGGRAGDSVKCSSGVRSLAIGRLGLQVGSRRTLHATY